MTKAHVIGFHHPLNDIAAALARAETIPDAFLAIDHQRRILVIVQRTQANQLIAASRSLSFVP